MSSAFQPDWVSPPGDTIKEILKEMKISNTAFVLCMDISFETARQLLEGELQIDQEIADKLAKVIGSSQSFWLKREENYRKSLYRGSGDGSAGKLKDITRIPKE